MEAFIKRIEIELVELEEKLEKLNYFIENNEIFKTLNQDHKDLLIAQRKTMKKYAHILKMRILLLKE